MNNTIEQKGYKVPATGRPCMVAMAKHNVKHKIEKSYHIKEDKCFAGGSSKVTIKIKKLNK